MHSEKREQSDSVTVKTFKLLLRRMSELSDTQASNLD